MYRNSELTDMVLTEDYDGRNLSKNGQEVVDAANGMRQVHVLLPSLQKFQHASFVIYSQHNRSADW